MRHALHLPSTCLFLLAAAGTAAASAPTGVWSRPTEVTIVGAETDQPMVVIAGLFSVWSGEGTVGGDWGMQGYEPGDWGYMVYGCKGGDKALCLMQWGEIATAARDAACVGWGNQEVAPGSVRGDDDTTTPDAYPLDQGVVTGYMPCNYLATVPPEDPPVADTVPPAEPVAEPAVEPGPEPEPEPAVEPTVATDTGLATTTTAAPDASSGADTTTVGGTEAGDDAGCAAGLIAPGWLMALTLLGLGARAARRRR